MKTKKKEIFSKIYNDAPDPTFDGSEFDFLLKPDEVLSFGNTKIEVIPTPGHTLLRRYPERYQKPLTTHSHP